MRHVGALHPELGTLLDAKTMLLVDDGETKPVEDYGVLDECVSADEDVHLA